MLGHSIVSLHFMETEGSIPNSQKPSQMPYKKDADNKDRQLISLDGKLISCLTY
jgi:hypothetical protein